MSERGWAGWPAPAGEEAPRRVSGSLSVLPPMVLLQAARAARKDLRLSLREHASGQVVVLVFRRGEPTMVFSPGDGRSVGEMLVAAELLDQLQLARLLEERRLSGASLERLLTERTSLTHAEIQRFFDFQARMRLLDALAWQQGYFELVEYVGGGETTYRLQLPSLEALAGRAKSRAAQLPGLLGRLPAPPAHVVVRRRRGAEPPAAPLARDIFELLHKPLLLPQIIAKLLVDDDLVLEAVLAMAAAKTVAIYPRLELVTAQGSGKHTGDLQAEGLAEEFLRRFRRADVGSLVQGIWLVVVAVRGDEAARLVAHLGGEKEEVVFHNSDLPLTLLARSVPVGPMARLHLLAIQPDILSPAALAGILGRCDAVVLLRQSASSEEETKLAALRRAALGGGFGWQPLVVGLDLGASFRPWQEYPDAVLALPSLGDCTPQALAKSLLEALLAATASRRKEEGS